MAYQDILDSQTQEYNKLVTHPLQSYEWGEFRKKTGIKVIRKGLFENNKLTSAFQVTIHKIPHTPFFAGYFPKGNMPDKETINELAEIGGKENCIFIQLEPNVICHSELGSESPQIPEKMLKQFQHEIFHLGLRPAVHPLFTRFTFQLDLTQTEEQLLKNMHSKTRYNIKIAQKNGVNVEEDNSNEAFETYIKLTNETTTRQGFYAHSEKYHRLMWETLKPQFSVLSSQFSDMSSSVIGKPVNRKLENQKQKTENRKPITEHLTAHLLVARYTPPSQTKFSTLNSQLSTQILVAWILFVFKDTLYYPYGASSREHREVMASNFMMWEAIRFGKKLGLTKFDMWGALGPNPDPKDPWFGFHRFKQGYGPEHIEFVGSYDLVTNPFVYPIYAIADKIRWFLLNLKK